MRVALDANGPLHRLTFLLSMHGAGTVREIYQQKRALRSHVEDRFPVCASGRANQALLQKHERHLSIDS